MNKRNYLFILLMLLLPIGILAVPATPYPILVHQPDGSTLTILKHGDEWFNYTTTKDGYLLKCMPSGEYRYAQLIDKEIVATDVVAHDIRNTSEKRFVRGLQNDVISKEELVGMCNMNRIKRMGESPSRIPNPLYGDVHGIVILVEFSDKSFESATAKQDFTNLLNQEGYSVNGATGSAKDYFKATTLGQFNPTFDVVGPYKLSGTVATYGENGAGGSDVGATTMVKEACDLADAAGVDFSKYDTDNNGVVDQIFVYYAGDNEAEGGPANTIWPHRFRVNTSKLYDGKNISDYACTSEKNGHNKMCGIGTFCHEFGHILGLPDMYDTSKSGVFTVGDWDIMASGSYNNNGNSPPTWLAHERFYVGYLQPEVLTGAGTHILEPIVSSNTAYIISPPNDYHNRSGSSPSPAYYYLLENRQYVGWDNATKLDGLGHGLLITKINYNSSTWAYNTVNNDPNKLGVDIVEADGSVKSYMGDTYPGSKLVTQFFPKQKDGSMYDGILSDIQEVGESVTFCYRDCGKSGSLVLNPNKTVLHTVVGDEPDKAIVDINGKGLDADIRVSLSGKDISLFDIKEQGKTTWGKTVILSPNIPGDSTLSKKIEVRYNPLTPSFSKKDTITFIAKSVKGIPVKVVYFVASSSRKVYVVPPVLKNFTDTTSYGAKAHWEKVDKAEGYYLTIYQKNGSFSETETFDNFNNLVAAGWKQTFYTTTTASIPSEPMAVLFANDLDTLWSCLYPQPLTEISFWLRNEDTRQEGNINIAAQNENGIWDNVATIKIDASVDYKIYKYPLSVDKKYNRIKLSCSNLNKGVSVDDFKATYTANVAINRLFVENGATIEKEINGLQPSTLYYAMIQATDKDPNGKYENVTKYSNEVELRTLDAISDDPNYLQVLFSSSDKGGNPVVLIPEEDKDKDLFVYDVVGKIVRVIPSSSYPATNIKVEIKGLPKGVCYIISLGGNRKSKRSKVYVR